MSYRYKITLSPKRRVVGISREPWCSVEYAFRVLWTVFPEALAISVVEVSQ